MSALIIALIITAAGVAIAIIQSKTVAAVIKPIYVLMASLYCTLWALIFPLVVIPVTEEAAYSPLTGFFTRLSQSFISAFQVFSLDSDMPNLLKILLNETGMNVIIREIYACSLMICAVLARVYTLIIVFSFLKPITNSFKYHHRKSRKRYYIFSALTEKSFSLAMSIKAKRKDAQIVFASAKSEKRLMDEAESLRTDYSDFAGNMKELSPIFLKKDVIELNYGGFRYIPTIFICDDDEADNALKAVLINSKYENTEEETESEIQKKRKKIVVKLKLYVFVSKKSHIDLLSAIPSVNVLTVVKHEAREFVYNFLKEARLVVSLPKIIEKEKRCKRPEDCRLEAIPIRCRSRIAIIGMGEYGKEMLKALLWMFQLPGYEVKFDIFDKMDKDDLKSMMEAEMPDIMSFKGDKQPGEPFFKIETHSGFDIMKRECQMQLVDLVGIGNEKNDDKGLDYIFVALGDDEKNFEVTMKMNDLLYGTNLKTHIDAIVYNEKKYDYKKGTKQRALNIEYVFRGDLRSLYSCEVMCDFSPELYRDKNEKCANDGNYRDETEKWSQESDYYAVSLTKSIDLFKSEIDRQKTVFALCRETMPEKAIDLAWERREIVFNRTENKHDGTKTVQTSDKYEPF